MEEVNVAFIFSGDDEEEKRIVKEKHFKVGNYVTYREADTICLDSITESNKNEVIVDFCDENFKTVSINIDTVNDITINIHDKPVVDFLKYITEAVSDHKSIKI